MILIAVVLIFWQILSVMVDNAILLPSVWAVAGQMFAQVQTTSFYLTLLHTLIRVVFSLLLSFLAGLILALINHRFQTLAAYFNSVLLFLRSVPNVTFIILFLFWFNRNMAVIVVAFLLLFPILYQNIYDALKDIDRKWKDLFQIYPQPMRIRIRDVYFPLLKTPIGSGVITCSSLAFKVVVMGEIMASVQTGIGRSMQASRLNLDLASVLAWTLWLLICVGIFNTLLRKVLNRWFG